MDGWLCFARSPEGPGFFRLLVVLSGVVLSAWELAHDTHLAGTDLLPGKSSRKNGKDPFFDEPHFVVFYWAGVVPECLDLKKNHTSVEHITCHVWFPGHSDAVPDPVTCFALMIFGGVSIRASRNFKRQRSGNGTPHCPA